MIDNLKIAISENDIEKARRIMINELIGTNYPHEVFKDAMELAAECNIFEEHDNGKLNQNVKDWDKEYLEKLIAGLGKNFSRERFLTAYYVARKIEQEKKDAEMKVETEIKNTKQEQAKKPETIEEKALFDMELAYIARFVYNSLYSIKIVSDNLSYDGFKSFDGNKAWKEAIEKIEERRKANVSGNVAT